MSDKLNKEILSNILEKSHPVDIQVDGDENVIDNNIQVDKDEDMNDFFDSWKKFKNRPSRISIFSQFDSEGIWTLLRDNLLVTDSQINKVAEIFPEPMGVIYNVKYFVTITNDIAVSFYEFDKEADDEDMEEIYSSNLTIYYNSKNVSVDEVNVIIAGFQQFMIDSNDNADINHKTVNQLYLNTSNQFELKPLEYNESMTLRELKCYYNNDIIKDARESIGLINNSLKGLTILNGYRGNGKTTFLSHIIKKLSKKVIYVPTTMMEHTFNNLDFSDFLKSNPNSVLIFDDCEGFFTRAMEKTNLYSINLLQVLDGLTSNSYNINIILVANANVDDLDSNLFESNSFLSCITFKKLNKNKANKLAIKLGKEANYTKDTKLGDIISNKLSRKDATYY